MNLGSAVPPTTESQASGAIRKRIRRGDAEFARLVSYPEATRIVFKDEEHSGGDMRMAPRLAGCLAGLAALVYLEWGGTVRLRVTEAWDEEGEHSERALHYEGRAADITTSDVDQRKLPRLAMLATWCGFSWVYYENKAHVHVSVRRDGE